MRIDLFEMERMQSLYWHRVDYDLSESGVRPLTVAELLGESEDGEAARAFVRTALGYPLSEGSEQARERIAQWYPGAGPHNVTVMNGGSEANFLTLWTLLEPGDRLAFMVPNYLQGWGLGRHFADATDTFGLKLTEREGGDLGWALDVDELERAVTERTKAIMVCNPNNPTGHVLSADEMDAIVGAASRVGAWIVADEIYRGAEVHSDEATPTFWGRSDKVVVTSGLSKAFGMPGLRVGWAVAPTSVIEGIWIHHDYTTLTPGMLSDRLCAVAMEPVRREWVLARTRDIMRRQLPPLEEWIASHDDIFRYARPQAGAIAYVEYDLPIESTALVDRIREEGSVLLVPGDAFGLGKGIRFGFGFEIEHTLKGLARVDDTLAALA
jgi:aspartate/methionine/tyrosine aminotransferase